MHRTFGVKGAKIIYNFSSCIKILKPIASIDMLTLTPLKYMLITHTPPHTDANTPERTRAHACTRTRTHTGRWCDGRGGGITLQTQASVHYRVQPNLRVAENPQSQLGPCVLKHYGKKGKKNKSHLFTT